MLCRILAYRFYTAGVCDLQELGHMASVSGKSPVEVSVSGKCLHVQKFYWSDSWFFYDTKVCNMPSQEATLFSLLFSSSLVLAHHCPSCAVIISWFLIPLYARCSLHCTVVVQFKFSTPYKARGLLFICSFIFISNSFVLYFQVWWYLAVSLSEFHVLEYLLERKTALLMSAKHICFAYWLEYSDLIFIFFYYYILAELFVVDIL